MFDSNVAPATAAAAASAWAGQGLGSHSWLARTNVCAREKFNCTGLDPTPLHTLHPWPHAGLDGLEDFARLAYGFVLKFYWRLRKQENRLVMTVIAFWTEGERTDTTHKLNRGGDHEERKRKKNQ
jgi:hypothetical protein